MEKSIQIKSKNKIEAIKNAMSHFNVLENDLEIKEIKSPTKGFLGIFGSKDGIYEITLKNIKDENCNIEKIENNEQIKKEDTLVDLKEDVKIVDDKNDCEYAREFLENLIKHFDIDAKVNVSQKGNIININISGDNLNYLIGKKGETLDSIQLLTGIYLNKINKNSHFRVNLNIGNYREKREEYLKKYSQKVSSIVLKTKKKRKLEYMNAYERRIMHSLLQKEKNINTYSEGEEPYRRLVVEYVEPSK